MCRGPFFSQYRPAAAFIGILASAAAAYAGVDFDTGTVHERSYEFHLTTPYELGDIADAGVSLNRLLIDAWYRGFGAHVRGTAGSILEGFWHFFVTFNTSQWPHELGHWARARQLGGDFRVTSYGFPAPVAEMDLPHHITETNRDALASVGGHEVNSLMKRRCDLEYHRRGYGYSDELIHGMIQGVFYPLYALIIAPADPLKPDTWLKTRGDPVESTLIPWKRYSGREPVRADGTVDPDLAFLYYETAAVSLLAAALDPMVHTGIRAFRHPMSVDNGLMHAPPFNEHFGFSWTYGLQFNPGPLGYELYLTTYLRLNGRRGHFYATYVKVGRPFRNIGAGVVIPDAVRWGPLAVDAGLEVFDQIEYGTGFCVHAESRTSLWNGWEILVRGYAKSVGYVVGRRVESCVSASAGIGCRFR